MEISSGYTAKTIPKADNATNGRGAKGDNFADLLSNMIDNKSSAPPEDTNHPDNNADNKPQDDAQNKTVDQNLAANDETPVEAIEKPPVKNDLPADETNRTTVDAQQAMLSLILNQVQQPVANAATSAQTDTDNDNATKTMGILDVKTNLALVASLVQNGATKVTQIDVKDFKNANFKLADLKNVNLNSGDLNDGDLNVVDLNEVKSNAALLNNSNGTKSPSVDELKLDINLKPNSDANSDNKNNVSTETAKETETSESAKQNANQNNKNLSNQLVKNNFAVHQQSQASENTLKTQDIKTQDISSFGSNTFSATDNSSSASTSDINTSATAQSNGVRINLDNIQSLAAIMVRRHFNGDKSFTIRLDPPELGEIKVELKIDKEKKAKAVISASNQEALGDLTKSVKDLAQSLKDSGIDINEEDFEFNLNNQSEDNEFAEHARSKNNNNTSEKTTSEEVQPEIINPIIRGTNRMQVWQNVRVSLIA